MTKEITKAFILQQIRDKFKLRELEPERFKFSETVVPIYNIESHLETREILDADVSITSAAAFTFFTVPQDERWVVRAYNPIPLGAGAFTMAGMYLQRGKTAGDYIYLDLAAGQTVAYLKTLNPPVICDPDDILKMNIDGFTAVQTLRVKMDVTREKVR